ncbi:hypothetical protein [Streptomyces sp. NPDC059256]|uniref:hypothetical protein n=1 Tax=Streptomyces sp. NPDC059256 TaxID=3346794 RepID=UPI0036967809
MNGIPHPRRNVLDTEELRSRAQDTREQLGQTIEALAAKAEVGEMGEQVRAKASAAKTQLADAATAVSDKLREVTPPPVQETTALVAETARRKRVPLLALGIATVALVVLARRRGR